MADRYLFVWYQKAETVGDQVWASLRDSNLDEVHTGPILLSGDTQALYPSVIAGDDEGMERAGEGRMVRWATDMPNLHDMGQIAGREAVAALGARKIKSTTALPIP